MGHGLLPRHLLSLHAPLADFTPQSMPYMLAVGPPTSWTIPLKPFLEAMRSTSATMESSDLLTTVLPWWAAMAQKAHSP